MICCYVILAEIVIVLVVYLWLRAVSKKELW